MVEVDPIEAFKLDCARGFEAVRDRWGGSYSNRALRKKIELGRKLSNAEPSTHNRFAPKPVPVRKTGISLPTLRSKLPTANVVLAGGDLWMLQPEDDSVDAVTRFGSGKRGRPSASVAAARSS